MGLIVILLIPIYKQTRLSQWFNCRKEKIDDNDLIKSHDENNRNTFPSQPN